MRRMSPNSSATGKPKNLHSQPGVAERTRRHIENSIGTVIARNAIYDVDPTADTDRRVFEVIARDRRTC